MSKNEISESTQSKTKSYNKQLIKSILCVVCGSMIYSFGLVWILELGGYVSGGVTGASQLIVDLIKKFGGQAVIENFLGVFIGLINVPLLIIGWKYVSKHFVILTIISISLQSILTSILKIYTVSPFIYFLEMTGNVDPGVIDIFTNSNFNIANNSATALLQEQFMVSMSSGTKLLLAIIGGLITGFGAALCLKGGGSTGGMDIVSNYLVMKKRMPFTQLQFVVDTIIILASGLISVENVLFTIVRLIVYIKVLQSVYQTYQMTRIEIITENEAPIKEKLLKSFNHSMTIYDAVGGYTNKSKKIIEVYVMKFEVEEYMQIIHQTDPKAFVVITQVKTIDGNYVQRTII